MTTTWHAGSDLLTRYAAGDADDVVASSLEAHLVACATCRARLRDHVPKERLAASWDCVVQALDAPRRGVLERVLTRLGVRASTARLLAATPTLRWSWLASMAVAVAFALSAAARPSTSALVFLLAAPLVPLVGVAVAFSAALDPSAEMVDATPLGGLPLLFLRTVASVAPSMAVAAVSGLLVAPVAETWAVWLLPALALSALSLLLASLAPIGRVAGALASVWAVAVVATEAVARGSFRAVRMGGPVESVLFGASGQLAAAAVALLAAVAVVTLSNRHLEPGRHA